MSETQTGAPTGQESAGTPAAGQTLSDQRYIPYSGGCLGWYENSGVLKVEKPNNYQFFTALDADLVRARQFERTGSKVNKRRARRKELDPEMKITLKWGKDSKSAVCKDLSVHGMRAQIIDEQVTLKKDDKVQLQVHDKSGRTLLLDLACTVMWAEKAGKLRAIWTFGVTFPTLTADQVLKVKDLGGLVDEE